MEIRGERECSECGTNWSYFETGSVACPDCGSLRSVGTGERKQHTDAPAELELDSVLARLDEEPVENLAEDVKRICRSYVRKRGFIRGGELKPLDDAYLAAGELLQAADLYGRLRDPSDDEEWYVISLLRAADTGERPPTEDVPTRMREARGLAAASAVLEYRGDVSSYLDEHPDSEVRGLLGAVRERAKRIEALGGGVPPAEADALVDAARAVGRYLIVGETEALAEARDRLADSE